MARLFGDDFKELVRARTDIVGLIAESVALQSQRGGREFVGLCPFHDDHNPSLRVYPDRQSYRCWVCDSGGDCYSFVMNRERVTFPEALEMLALRANIELPKAQRGASGAGSVENKNRLYEIVGWAQNEFHECLLKAPEAERARRYLRERGITGTSISRFKLGFHPNDWEWLIRRARPKYTPQQLASVGLAAERKDGSGFHDYFMDRVLFPIRDAQGRPVAFGGRVLPDAPATNLAKYWNGPDTLLFHKSRNLYALDLARESISKSHTAVVVEGYTDCVMAHQHGLTNFVATLGTALNEQSATALKRFARRVVLLYDGDEAGQKAAERVLSRLLAHEIDLRICTLPGGLDPDELLLQQGPGAFRTLLDGAVEAWEHKFRLTVGRHGLDSIDARHRVLQEMLDVLAQVPVTDGAGLASSWQLRENVILGRLAQSLRVSEDVARTRLAELRGAHAARGAERPVVRDDAETQRPRVRLFPDKPGRDELAEREVLEIVFLLPDQVPALRREIGTAEFTNPHLRALLEICFELEDEGVSPSYDRVTARLEDAGLKALAAEIDEHARQVGVKSELLAHTLAYFRRRREVHQPALAAAGPHLDGTDDPKARLRMATELHRKRQTKSTLS